jgi:hypothetical protein
MGDNSQRTKDAKEFFEVRKPKKKGKVYGPGKKLTPSDMDPKN